MLLQELLESPVAESLLYLEQQVNHLFQGWQGTASRSEVNAAYRPETGTDYAMPYVWLDLTHPAVEWYAAEPDPRLLSAVRAGELVKFFVHPEMIPEYRENHLADLLAFAGVQHVAPTASTRTVLTRDAPYPFMIKANMTRRVGFLRRKLRRRAVAQGLQVTRELAELAALAPPTVAYLPESIGCVYHEDIGMIVRECQARPLLDEPRPLVPFFALISRDARRPADPVLLSQIVEQPGGDPFETFCTTLLYPLLTSWAYLVFERGILPTPHAQNLLLELDSSGTPARMVFRDLQDCAIDAQVRRAKGLHCQFARHFVDDLEHLALQVGAEPVRDVHLARQIRYSLNYDFWLGTLLRCLTVVLSKYPVCTAENIACAARTWFWDTLPSEARACFPPEQFFIQRIDEANPRLRLVERRGKPLYR